MAVSCELSFCRHLYWFLHPLGGGEVILWKHESAFRSRNSADTCYPVLTLHGLVFSCYVQYPVLTPGQTPLFHTPQVSLGGKPLLVSFTNCLDCAKHRLSQVTDHLRMYSVGTDQLYFLRSEGSAVGLFDRMKGCLADIIQTSLSIWLAKEQVRAGKGF